jgi:hypothetical protein
MQGFHCHPIVITDKGLMLSKYGFSFPLGYELTISHQTLEGLKNLRAPTLVVVLLPERAAEFRAEVKRWGDLHTGIMTQCLVSHICYH